MEKDVEERLRQKFTLIDRTDPAAIAAAQQVSILWFILLLKMLNNSSFQNLKVPKHEKRSHH